MVERVRRGASMREVARSVGVSLSVVQRWVERASGQRLDRVDWSGRATGSPTNRTTSAVEDLVLVTRQRLRTTDLGDHGAEAIRAALFDEGLPEPPAIRTIGRVLERRGVLDSQGRVRRLAPPPGWYLPDVAVRRAELDSFDTVSGLLLRGRAEVVVLNGISLHGGLVTSWPHSAITARLTATLLVEHWRQFGRPAYAQFDNDNIFQGPHQHKDVIGRVMRVCLLLGIIPVFAPPREPGFQAAVESFNGRWQTRVWSRFDRTSLDKLREHSTRYVAAARAHAALRIERAPARLPMPAVPHLALQAHPSGTVIFIRRTDDGGYASLLGHRFLVDPLWPNRLVRSEVHLDAGVIRFFALRRREHTSQPMLAERSYLLPRRHFTTGD